MHFVMKIFIFCVFAFLMACKPASLEAPGSDKGFGTVQDFSISPNVRMALYSSSDTEAEKQPELEFGSMDVHYVTLDGTTYMVDWSDIEDFKSLKIGAQIPFRSNGYLAREESTGKNYRVIMLNES